MESEKPKPTVEKRPDGTTVVSTPGGATLDIAADRNVKLDLKAIEAVGLHNLIDVESHQIARIAGSTSHFVRFHGGGELRFAYNDQGRLIELSAKDCGFSLTDKNELFFTRKKAP